jgi:hypothetical protein
VVAGEREAGGGEEFGGHAEGAWVTCQPENIQLRKIRPSDVQRRLLALRRRVKCAELEPKLRDRGGDEISKWLAIKKKIGGRGRDRTGDPLLAKQVLSQLSYTPTAPSILS